MMKNILGMLVCAILIITIFPAGQSIENRVNNDLLNSEIEDKMEEINYFISVEDHPDILDNSRVDNIAEITLVGGGPLDISNIKILITNDMINYLEPKIVKTGTWEIGEKITIRENNPADAERSYYKVYIVTAKEKRPFVLDFVNIDNAPLESSKFFNNRNEKNIASYNPPSDKASSCYYEDYPGSTIGGAAIGIDYPTDEINPTWISPSNVWEYTFYIDIVFGTGYGSTCNWIELQTETTNCNDGYYKYGAWNLNEYSTGTYEEIAADATLFSIECLEKIPLISYIFDAESLVEKLRDTPHELKWEAPATNPYSMPGYASAFAWQAVWVSPDTNWNIKNNIEVKAWDIYCTTPLPYYMKLDSSFYHGQGKIEYDGKAPSGPEFKITYPEKGKLYLHNREFKIGSSVAIMIKPTIEATMYAPGASYVKFIPKRGNHEDEFLAYSSAEGYFSTSFSFPTAFVILRAEAYNNHDALIGSDKVLILFIKTS